MRDIEQKCTGPHYKPVYLVSKGKLGEILMKPVYWQYMVIFDKVSTGSLSGWLSNCRPSHAFVTITQLSHPDRIIDIPQICQ